MSIPVPRHHDHDQLDSNADTDTDTVASGDSMHSRDWSDEDEDGDVEEEGDSMTLPLEPFDHAVGGHSSIYKFTRRAVCKPLVSRENLFYEEVERLAPALLAYIPRYLGVMSVNYRRSPRAPPSTPAGSATPQRGVSPFPSAPTTPGSGPNPNSYRPTLHPAPSCASIQSDPGIGVEIPEVSIDFNRHGASGTGTDWLFRPTSRVKIPPSPSVIEEDSRQELFIFMEDLTGRLKHPCVLDLKMGTRQYGCDATPLKKRSQRKKCDATTSRTLGVRMCGMQVWNTVTDSFTSKNKYKGREIKTPDFHRVLKHFLHDGESLLVAHIPSIIQKLHNLAEIILDLDGFRFYGCSLLLIYDGDKEAQDHFLRYSAHRSSHRTRTRTGSGATLERVDEDGWGDIRHRPSRTLATTRDEQQIIEQTRTLLSRRSKSVEYDPIIHRSRSRRDSVTRRGGDRHDTLSSQGTATPDSKSNTKRIRGEVNIRVVDFAHTTTGLDFIPFPPDHVDKPPEKLGKGYDSPLDPETGLNLARFPPKHPHRPDMGFVFGLKNVCWALEGLWRDNVGDEEVNRWLRRMDNRDVFIKVFGQSDELAEGELST